MGILLSFLLVILAGLFAIPVIVFCIEILAAIALPQQEFLLVERRRIAVLVPAHNESKGMLGTLDDIKAQLRSGDRLLVVADNCTDDTAAVAKVAGAEVTERHDLARIGKGYALDWGLQHLSVDPPEIVIVIDADCRLATNTLDQARNGVCGDETTHAVALSYDSAGRIDDQLSGRACLPSA